MAITDYSTNPDNNTTVGGVFIGELCPAANLNNGERAIMADIATAFGGGIAMLTDWAVGTATNKYYTPSSMATAVAPVTITDAAAITLDLATGLRFTLNKTTNGTMALTNAKVGYTYVVDITQDATGGRALAKPTAPAGVTVKVARSWAGLSTPAGVSDVMTIYIASATQYRITLSKGFVV
jgi:hypothetical protein